MLRKASNELNLVTFALSMIDPVEMLRDSIYLSGGVLDRLLCAVGGDLGLLSRGARSICRSLSLLGLQLGLLCSLAGLLFRAATPSESGGDGKHECGRSD